MKRFAVTILMLASAACSQATIPTAPSAASATATTPAGPVQCASPLSFPDVTGPARIFMAPNSCPSASRFVLYDDGTFVLQHATVGGEYNGTYSEAGGAVAFRGEATSTAGAWTAEGTIVGDALSVHFDDNSQLGGLQDSVYP